MTFPVDDDSASDRPSRRFHARHQSRHRRRCTDLRPSSGATIPGLRPETIRALLVHSATWTPKMRERFSGDQKSVIQQCLRCYGYGVPDLQRAVNSAENVVNLIYRGGTATVRQGRR